MTPEGIVKKKIKAILKAQKCWFFMPMQTGYSAPGIPDFVICANGLFIGLEAKAGKNKPTAAQHNQLRLIEEAGGIAIVVNELNLPKLNAFISSLNFTLAGPTLDALEAAEAEWLRDD